MIPLIRYSLFLPVSKECTHNYSPIMSFHSHLNFEVFSLQFTCYVTMSWNFSSGNISHQSPPLSFLFFFTWNLHVIWLEPNPWGAENVATKFPLSSLITRRPPLTPRFPKLLPSSFCILGFPALLFPRLQWFETSMSACGRVKLDLFQF